MSAEEKVYTFAVKRKQLNIKNLIIMITNYDTNIVYFAEGLKHVKYVGCCFFILYIRIWESFQAEFILAPFLLKIVNKFGCLYKMP